MTPSPTGPAVATFNTAVDAASSAGLQHAAAFAYRQGAPTASLARGPFPLSSRSFDFESPSGAPTAMMVPPQPSFRQRRLGSNSSSPPQRRVLMKLDDVTEEMGIRPKEFSEKDSVEGDIDLRRRNVGTHSDENGAAPGASSEDGGVATEISGFASGDVRSWLAGLSAESVTLLNLVAVIWGTQHPVIKMVVDDCDASAFSFARFGLGALLASRYTPPLGPVLARLGGGGGGTAMSDAKKDEDEEVGSSTGGALTVYEPDLSKEKDDAATVTAWRWGLEMGTWMFLGYAFQAIGLAFTTAQRSGFLLYLNVKFVPFFARILFGRDISAATWASAFTALAGTGLLSYDGSDLSLNVGDLWSVAAAAASAMFILRLESASSAVKDSSALNAASLWVVTAACLVWTIGKGIVSPLSPDLGLMEASRAVTDSVIQTVVSHPFALIYLGGVTTALANYIQTKAQKDISAERASIIYAMDPVYGAVFASVLLGESLNGYGIAGAGLITLAAATNAFLDLGPGKGVSVDEDKNDKT